MTNSKTDPVEAAPRLPEVSSRLSLHAFLYRFCALQVSTLCDCSREPLWCERAAKLEREARSWVEKENWAAQCRRRFNEEAAGGSVSLVVFCSAVLRAFDAYHLERRLEVERQLVELPHPEGGLTVFLAPPEEPIHSLVPRNRRITRRTGDLKNDLRTVLNLWWCLLALENLPVQPVFLRLPELVSAELGRRLKSGDLRVALASPFGQLAYEASGDAARRHPGDGRIPYRFTRLASRSLAAARRALDEIFSCCATEQVDLLCFPELTLDTDLLAHVRLLLETRNSTLHPALVMAGSFHVDAGASQTGWVNRCRVLDGFGNVLFAQDKCVAFGVPASQAAEMDPSLRAMFGIDERGGYEDIRLSKTFSFFDCDLGRLATPICLDFCGDELRDLLVASGANLLLVPAMTQSMDLFYVQARHFGTHSRATTFVANSDWLLRNLGLSSPELRALAYVPAKGRLQAAGKLLSEELMLRVFSIRELVGLAEPPP